MMKRLFAVITTATLVLLALAQPASAKLKAVIPSFVFTGTTISDSVMVTAPFDNAINCCRLSDTTEVIDIRDGVWNCSGAFRPGQTGTAADSSTVAFTATVYSGTAPYGPATSGIQGLDSLLVDYQISYDGITWYTSAKKLGVTTAANVWDMTGTASKTFYRGIYSGPLASGGPYTTTLAGTDLAGAAYMRLIITTRQSTVPGKIRMAVSYQACDDSD